MSTAALRPRLPLVGVALAAAIGIGAADFWETSSSWSVIATVVLAVVVLFWPRTALCGAFVGTAFFALHTLRHHGGEGRRLSEYFHGGPRPVEVVGVVWNEPQAPKKWSRFVTCHFLLKLESLRLNGASFPADAKVLVRWDGQIPEYGDRVSLSGAAENLESPRNPGQFDYAAFERRQGVFTEVTARYASDCRILESGCGHIWTALALRGQKWMRRQLELDLGDAPQVAALIESMVLGIQGDTPEDLKELFQRTGTVHLFAVSGLTVGMVASLLWFVLKSLQISRARAVFIIIPLLIAYALVTGLRTSCVRATVMAALLLAGHLFDRRPSGYNSLAAAAVLILAWDTDQLFSAGFQFSFAIVFVVIWLSTGLRTRLDPLGQPDPFLPRPLWSRTQRAQAAAWSLLANAFAVSLASFLGSILFTAGYFHLLSPTSVFANLAAVPLAFAVLALGLASVVSAVFSPALAVLFNNANYCFASWLLAILHLFDGLPGGYIYVGRPRLPGRSACELTVLDLGAGGSTHLRFKGKEWLIDCGHGFEYERIVLPYLRLKGVNWLDGLILTHGNAQYLGGAIPLLDDFAPRIVVDSAVKDKSSARRLLQATLASRQTGKRIVQHGDVIEFTPEARVRVLYPPAGIQKNSADDKALALLLEAEGKRVLFMSDGGFSTEQWLLQNEPDLRADLLVKGQHSKDLSGTPDFLLHVHPEAIICAAAKDPAAAPVLDAWTESVRERGIVVFRQDQTGAVAVTLRSGEMRADGFLNGQTFRSNAR